MVYYKHSAVAFAFEMHNGFEAFTGSFIPERINSASEHSEAFMFKMKKISFPQEEKFQYEHI